MRTLRFIAAFTIALHTEANATRWIVVATSPGVSRYIDVDEVVVDDAVATIWLKTEYSDKGESGEKRSIEKWMEDCAKGRAKLLALTLYKGDGTVIGSAELPRYRQNWVQIVPGSVGEVIHQRVCAAIDSNSRERSPHVETETT